MGKSRVIALSGISSALCLVFIVLGSYVPLLGYSCLIFASVALLLPLYKNSLVGGALAYLSSSMLAFLLAGFKLDIVLGFALFFGLYPIVDFLAHKFKLNKWLALVIKIIIFNISFVVLYKFTFLFVIEIEFLQDNFIILILAFTLLFVLYDFLMKNVRLYFFRVLNRLKI